MQKSVPGIGKILVTGGTSGFGLELVKLFLGKGYEVTATGRNMVSIPGYSGKFTLLITDFSNLNQTSYALKQTCKKIRFDIVVNNAGVLGTPDFLLTGDGNEYTFQVNFLSHLLINEIILRNSGPGGRIKIAAIVSPVYRIAEKDLILRNSRSDYKMFRAYSNSKLYLALMCSYLPIKYPLLDLKCIGFDPGVFSSGIYRTQREWFRILYKVAAPFMRRPGKIAGNFAEIVERDDLVNGVLYKSDKRIEMVSDIDNNTLDTFWKECYKKIEPYL